MSRFSSALPAAGDLVNGARSIVNGRGDKSTLGDGMCFSSSRISRLRRWNWDGERIIHESIVPSSRPVVMQQKGWYDIDVREFLVSENNAIMRRTLQNDVKKFIEKFEGASWELFLSRNPGSFDLRSYVITQFVSEKIEYRESVGLDPW